MIGTHTSKNHIPLSKARHLFPTLPSHSTILRWCTVGVCGVRLENIRCGAFRYTTPEAIAEFLEVLNRED